MANDPLTAIKKPGFAHARKLTRRYLLHEEWRWLAQTPNAILYETAIQTGLRSNELRMLEPCHLHADHLLLPAEFTKNRRQARQWITEDLAKRLQTALPFQMPCRSEVARRLLYPDLAEARVTWLRSQPDPDVQSDFLKVKNSLGHVLDFHSFNTCVAVSIMSSVPALRHTCGAWLAMADVNPKVIQSVMRHSSIVLTLDTYGHLMPGAEASAAATLGEMLAAKGCG